MKALTLNAEWSPKPGYRMSEEEIQRLRVPNGIMVWKGPSLSFGEVPDPVLKPGQVMLEIAAGVYVAPDLSAAVRTRLWDVLSSWWAALGTGSVVIVWRDTKAVGDLRIQTLGEPLKEIVDADGVLLVKRRGETQLTYPSLKSIS